MEQGMYQLGDPTVFRRDHEPHPSDRFVRPFVFRALALLATVGGIVAAGGLAALVGETWPFQPHWAQLLLLPVGLGFVLIGSRTAVKSPSWAVSLAAYMIGVVVPAGVFVGIVSSYVALHPTPLLTWVVAEILFGVTLAALLGWKVQTDLQGKRIGELLTFIATLCTIFLVVVAFYGLSRPLSPENWGVVLSIPGMLVLFSISYNFNRSKYLPPTVDNAVDLGMQNFLEPLNLILRMVQSLRHWMS